MARYDVFESPDGNGYLLDVQAALLESLNTRIVVPLMPIDSAPAPAQRLNPVFEIGSEPHVMVTQFLSAVPAAILGAPLTSLAANDAAIMNALDLALTGV